MTSVIGLDIGNLSSKIGIARNRGIDIVCNEVSNRATPSLVSFGSRNRSLGESAKTLETSNFRNTVGSLKRLIGRSINDPEVEYEKQFNYAEFVDINGSVGVKVQYLGEEATFTATQLYAMYLAKLKDTVATESKAAVNDVVIAVPGWYGDRQRRAVLDAAEIAGLHPLRLVNDTTATALGYGLPKSDLPEKDQKPRYVVFCDIGHSDYSVAVVAYHKGQLTVKSTAFDEHFGGREFDKALVDHFAEEFKGKYKIDVKSNPKATFRLATSVERLKKVLSANAQAPISVESIMNDIDVSSSLSREDFEKLIEPLLNRTTVPLEKALADAGLTKDDIDSVELVGGSSRIPSLKQKIGDFFGKPLSFTSNQDEAVARGTTFTCAQLSPVFRTREFEITDIINFPVDINWEAIPEAQDDGTSIRAFEKGNTMPSTKMLTFYRKANFDLEAHYPSEIPPATTSTFISRYTVKNVKPTANGDLSTVRVKVRVNPSGILDFGPPTLVEEVEAEEETTPAETPAADQMETDKKEEGADANGDAAPAAAPKKVRKTIKHELPGVSGATSLEESILNKMREKEGEMVASDKLVAETEERKNALEEYIYDLREKLIGAWAPFAPEADKETLNKKCMDAEDWLYSEEGEDAKKSEYVAKLDDLKSLGDKIQFRYREHDERPSAERQLRETISKFNNAAMSGDEKYSHLTPEELQKVIEKCANTEKWLMDTTAKQAEKPKDVDPVASIAQINKQREQLVYDVTPILNKPKPKTTPTPTPTPSNTGSNKDDKSAEQTPEVEMEEENKEEKTNMDVD